MSRATIISVINWKGGVGKTTISHHVGTGLREIKDNDFDPKILLIDLDAQCNLSVSCMSDVSFEDVVYDEKVPTIRDLFDNELRDMDYDIKDFILKKTVRRKDGEVYKKLHLIPSHQDLIYTDMNIATYSKPDYRKNLMSSDAYKFQLLEKIISDVKDDYDYIIMDCPPNLNFITQNALYLSDYYIIPTILDRLSTYGILSITNKVTELNKMFSSVDGSYSETKLAGIIPNNVIERNGEPKSTQYNHLAALERTFGGCVFNNYLTLGDGIPSMSSYGYPVYTDKKNNSKKQSELLFAIIDELLERME